MKYTALLEHVRPPESVICRCDGCDETASADSLLPIGDAVLTPGDPSPAGRCSACGSLSYVDKPDASALLEILQQLMECVELNQDELDPRTVVLIDAARTITRGAKC